MVASFLKANVNLVLSIGVLTLVWFFVPTIADAQKISQEELDRRILQSIDKRKWPEVLELSRQLIWLDVEKASGYYYTALAHSEMGKPKLAKPFLWEAKRLDDGIMEAVLIDLERQIWEKNRRKYQDAEGFVPVRSMDRFYIALTYSPDLPFGLHVGSLNTHGIGTYFLLRGNQAMTTKTAGFTVNNSGSAYGSPYAKSESTGHFVTGMAEFLMGITWRLFEPVWMYSGIGLNHSREFWQMEVWQEGGLHSTEVWARNQQSNLNQPTVEMGLMADFKGINVRVGPSLTNFDLEQLRFHLGLGFSLRKK